MTIKIVWKNINQMTIEKYMCPIPYSSEFTGSLFLCEDENVLNATQQTYSQLLLDVPCTVEAINNEFPGFKHRECKITIKIEEIGDGKS